jgi:hypothetical protein
MPAAARPPLTVERKLRPANHPQPDPRTEATDPEPDPIEELCRIGDAYKQATGLTADDAIVRILSKVRSR